MGTPYLGEIKITSFQFPPRGWAMCNGQLLAINQNQALFSLLGTFYGGDGRVNFALPNLQGRAALHMNGPFPVGTAGGEDVHRLTVLEMPFHAHAMRGSTKPGASSSPAGGLLASEARGATPAYTGATNMVALHPGSLAAAGGGQPHENRMPYLTLNFVIALQGIFPSRN